MDTVSILIPCYNSEEYIEDSITSALMQTWPNCEIIVVDDGSTDDSLDVARRFESQGVRVIRQSNRGAAAARNSAFSASSGEYIQYLDADDLLSPDKIESQLKELQKCPPRNVAMGPTCFFRDEESPEEGHCQEIEGDLSTDDPVQWLIDLWTPGRSVGMVQTAAWLTPRRVVKDAGSWTESINLDDDGEFFTRVVSSSRGVRYVDSGRVFYRHHDDDTRVSGLQSRDALEGLIQSIDTRRDCVLPLASEDNRGTAKFAIARSYWKIAIRALPMYSDLAEKAEQRARSLGVDHPPEISVAATWKGNFIRKLFGWRTARRFQYIYRRLSSYVT